MKEKEKYHAKIKSMCKRVEDVFGWDEGTLKSKSSKNDVTRLRNQVILDAYENKTDAKHIASFFDKTVQSIYISINKAEVDREYQKKYSQVLGWLCDV